MDWQIIAAIIILLTFITGLYFYFISDKKIINRFDNYELIELPNLLTDKECDDIIELAKKQGLHESEVLNYEMEKTTTTDQKFRKSEIAWMNDTYPLVKKISKISESLTGYPMNTQEMLQVAHYKPGGMFNAHYDACVYKDQAYCNKINNNAGQRTTTLIIYLNDDFQGGETHFVNLDLKIKPVKGKGLLFKNVDKDDIIIEKSLHQGNEVKSGEKWICTKWSHSRQFS